MRQIDIFDIGKGNTYTNLLEQLESYGIDEYYRKYFKGKCELLRTIKEALEMLPHYYEYRTKMYEMLVEHFKDRNDVELVYYDNHDYIRIYTSIGTQPLFCLEMLDQEIL